MSSRACSFCIWLCGVRIDSQCYIDVSAPVYLWHLCHRYGLLTESGAREALIAAVLQLTGLSGNKQKDRQIKAKGEPPISRANSVTSQLLTGGGSRGCLNFGLSDASDRWGSWFV